MRSSLRLEANVNGSRMQCFGAALCEWVHTARLKIGASCEGLRKARPTVIPPGPAGGLQTRRNQRHRGRERPEALLAWPWMTGLAEPHPGTASVLVDELDAGGFESPPNGKVVGDG